MYLTSTGMVCSVGLSAVAACASMRAGIANFVELPYHDNQGEPIIGTTVPGLDRGSRRNERLIKLLSMALTDCLQEKIPEPLEKIPLLVGLAEPERPGVGGELADSIIQGVESVLGVQFHPQLSRVISHGHTSGFEGLRVARELFQNPGVPACIICGVDSYINARSLLWLELHDRLKTTDNSDGVIPGEAAAAVLLQPQTMSKAQSMVKVIGLGFADEKAGIISEEPLLGLGLAKAARAALAEARIQMHDIDFRLSDVTGESYGFKEQALAVARLMRVHREKFPVWHCADSIGDTGAAAGICQLVVAFHAFLKDYAPGDRVMCHTSAVYGDRAVAVLQRQGSLGSL